MPAPQTARTLAITTCVVTLIMMFPAAANAGSASPVVRRIDTRILEAEQQTLRWDARLNRWQSLVANAATHLEHLLAAAPKSPSRPVDYFVERSPGRYRLPPDPLSRARTALRTALDDPRALAAREQATTWRRYMNRLQAARRQALAAGRGAGVSGLPPGPITYGTWGRAMLSSLKAPACRRNMQVIVAWETAESTLARYNPLATVYYLPGAVPANTSGVQNYVSFAQGIEATRDTLLGGSGSFNYASIVDDLLACAPARKTAYAVWNSSWCSGCARGGYVIDQLPAVKGDWSGYVSRLVNTI